MPATDPHVLRVAGGNMRLPAGVLAAANATLRVPAAVTAVRRLADERYEIALSGSTDEGAAASAAGGGAAAAGGGSPRMPHSEGPFDAVIIAAPLEGSGIALEGLEARPFIPARKYHQVCVCMCVWGESERGWQALHVLGRCQAAHPACAPPAHARLPLLHPPRALHHALGQTVATFVQGAVRPSFFGLASMDYEAVLVTQDSGTPWDSLGLVSSGPLPCATHRDSALKP